MIPTLDFSALTTIISVGLIAVLLVVGVYAHLSARREAINARSHMGSRFFH